MTLYVVDFQGIDEGYFDAVFSTREKAEAHIKSHHGDGWSQHYGIVECELDADCSEK